MFDTVQKRVCFSGRVQGVGFRYATCAVAAKFKVTGTVKNLPDGRVELIAEAQAGEIDRFIDAIKNEMRSYVSDMTIEMAPPTGRFEDFRIAY
jgi:acylphosphatase